MQISPVELQPLTSSQWRPVFTKPLTCIWFKRAELDKIPTGINLYSEYRGKFCCLCCSPAYISCPAWENCQAIIKIFFKLLWLLNKCGGHGAVFSLLLLKSIFIQINICEDWRRKQALGIKPFLLGSRARTRAVLYWGAGFIIASQGWLLFHSSAGSFLSVTLISSLCSKRLNAE